MSRDVLIKISFFPSTKSSVIFSNHFHSLFLIHQEYTEEIFFYKKNQMRIDSRYISVLLVTIYQNKVFDLFFFVKTTFSRGVLKIDFSASLSFLTNSLKYDK